MVSLNILSTVFYSVGLNGILADEMGLGKTVCLMIDLSTCYDNSRRIFFIIH